MPSELGLSLYILLFMGSSPASVFSPKVFVQPGGHQHPYGCCRLFSFRMQLGTGWGFAAALLVALSPHLIVVNGYLLTRRFSVSFFVDPMVPVRRSEKTQLEKGDPALYAGCGVSDQAEFAVFSDCRRAASVCGGREAKRAKTGCGGDAWFFRDDVALDGSQSGNLKKISDDTIAVGSLHHRIYPNFMYEGIKKLRFSLSIRPARQEISRTSAQLWARLLRGSGAPHLGMRSGT
jgi:hypothetical protein